MKIKKIKFKNKNFRQEPIVVYWLYTDNDAYQLTGSISEVYRWVSKNIDRALPYVYHLKILNKTSNSLHIVSLFSESICKDKHGKIIDEPYKSEVEVKTIIGVYHPSIKVAMLPYEKYLNQIIKGDSSLEYTVNCHNQKQKYALVQKYQSGSKIYKLIADFKMIPRHYIKELNNYL